MRFSIVLVVTECRNGIWNFVLFNDAWYSLYIWFIHCVFNKQRNLPEMIYFAVKPTKHPRRTIKRHSHLRPMILDLLHFLCLLCY